MSDDFPAPHQRERIVGRSELEAKLRASLSEGVLSNGWLITGPSGAGKATLAFRLARAILDPAALEDDSSLQVSAEARVFRLISGEAHPDLFVAKRQYDEKKDRYETEITVETVRKLSSFLSKTASGGGWRVAIVDAADELNRNAANALLKSLEEPPPRTALLLVSSAPGRLIATIRSRCRRIDLRPLPDEEIIGLLMEEGGEKRAEAERIARAAHGRPGYALTLAVGEGAEAIAAVDAFFEAAAGSGDAGAVAAALSGKTAAERWEIFKEHLLERISEAARGSARGEPFGMFSDASPSALIEAYEQLAALLRRGDAVNLDRRDLVFALQRALRAHLRPRAA